MLNLRGEATFVPNVIAARTPEEKFVTYFLNPKHSTGGHKARLFDSILGYSQENWRELSDILFNAVQATPVSSIEHTAYGVKYKVFIHVTGKKGKRCQVLTSWQIDKGAVMPRIVTAYPLKETTEEV